MSLDLFTRNADDAVAYAARVSAPELPSTFSDNFGDAWNRGYLTAQSISGETRKITARSRMVDDAIAKTGDQSFGALEGEGGGFDVAAFNSKVAQHRAAKPDLNLPEMTNETIQQHADDIGAAQLSLSRNLALRERTAGGTFGQFLGSAAGAFTDPVNVVAFPLAAPASLGVLRTALAWSAIGGGSQAVIEALNAGSMERIQPGYANSSEPLWNVLEAGGAAGVLGGGLKALASAWTRYKTGTWPRTIRDAGNVVESEAQIANTNPLPGVAGEAAHRTALQKAIDDLANGRSVEVDGIVAPEQLAALNERAAPVLAARDAAVEAQQAARVAAEEVLASSSKAPELPFAQTEAAARAEASTASLTDGIQNVARLAGHEMPTEEAAKIAARLAQLNDPDKARALLDEVFLRPQTVADTLPAVDKPGKSQKIPENPTTNALRDEFTPAKIEEARAHPDMEETISRDLDKLMLEKPDLEVPTGVTVDADGRTVPTTRKVESVVAEADARVAAAKEIEACVGPYPSEAAA